MKNETFWAGTCIYPVAERSLRGNNCHCVYPILVAGIGEGAMKKLTVGDLKLSLKGVPDNLPITYVSNFEEVDAIEVLVYDDGVVIE